MSNAATTIVTIGTIGQGFQLPTLEVFTPYAAGLLEWYATGKERTHNLRAMIAGGVGDDADKPVDVTLAHAHIAFIITEVKHG